LVIAICLLFGAWDLVLNSGSLSHTSGRWLDDPDGGPHSHQSSNIVRTFSLLPKVPLPSPLFHPYLDEV
jgi:hypothetical protein